MKRKKEFRRRPGYRMSRSPMKARTRSIPKRPRSAAEFARIYGSDERVEWMQAQPCLICGRRPSDNAHTVTGGKGRKADHTTIVPLCSGLEGCHRKYDDHITPFDDAEVRARVRAAAAEVERRWQDHLNQRAAA